jgi:hypothetical protein
MSNAGSGRTPYVPATGITLLTISTLFILLRLFSRCSQQVGKLDIGDLFLGLGWVWLSSKAHVSHLIISQVSATAITAIAIHGQHLWFSYQRSATGLAVLTPTKEL